MNRLIGVVLSGDATDLFWQRVIPHSAIAEFSSSSATLLAFALLNVAMPAFPDGRYDDQVDALMLCLDWFAKNEHCLPPSNWPIPILFSIPRPGPF